jgi:hypothetical protein
VFLTTVFSALLKESVGCDALSKPKFLRQKVAKKRDMFFRFNLFLILSIDG